MSSKDINESVSFSFSVYFLIINSAKSFGRSITFTTFVRPVNRTFKFVCNLNKAQICHSLSSG